MAGGRVVQDITIPRILFLAGGSCTLAWRPSLRRKIVTKTHSVTYQNDAEQLIFCSISIYKTIYIARSIQHVFGQLRPKCVFFGLGQVRDKSGTIHAQNTEAQQLRQLISSASASPSIGAHTACPDNRQRRDATRRNFEFIPEG